MVLTRDATEAEDLVQKTYSRAIPRLAGLRVDSNLKSWLFATLRDIWLGQLRRGGIAPKIVAVEMDETVASTIIETSKYSRASDVSQTEHDWAREAIQRLPVELREIILLREFEELSYREIADILNCPRETIIACLARARTELLALLSTVADPSLDLHLRSSQTRRKTPSEIPARTWRHSEKICSNDSRRVEWVGNEFARQLAKKYDLILVARRKDLLEQEAIELKAKSGTSV